MNVSVYFFILFSFWFSIAYEKSDSGQWSAGKKYHFSPGGDDSNPGSLEKPWKTMAKLNQVDLLPGDQLLFEGGYTFAGTLELSNISGSQTQPILISSYNHQGGKATINAKNYASGILLENCSNIHVQDLLITADGGAFPGMDDSSSMRCGILVKTTKKGNYEDIELHGVEVKNVFFEEAGFQREKDEVKTANGKQSYGWGIRFINQTEGASLKDIIVEGCKVENVAHTGIKFTASDVGISNVKVLNNQVIKTGGPGIQMSRVQNALVKDNWVNFSGSNDDARK